MALRKKGDAGAEASSSPPGLGKLRFVVIISMFMATVPLALIVTGLLFLVFRYQVSHKDLTSIFDGYPKPEPTSYYVDFSATQLTTLASWLSSLAPYVPPATLALLALAIANSISRDTKLGRTKSLPSPRQLGILIRLVDGSLAGLFSWLLTPTPKMKKKRGETTVLALDMMGAVFIVTSLVSYAIWCADTWFHVSTSTVNGYKFRNVSSPRNMSLAPVLIECGPVSSTAKSGAKEYYHLNVTDNTPVMCFEYLRTDMTEITTDPYEIAAGESTDYSLLSTSLNGTDYSYIVPLSAETSDAHTADDDYLASTLATSASCTDIRSSCWWTSYIRHGNEFADNYTLTCDFGLTYQWLMGEDASSETDWMMGTASNISGYSEIIWDTSRFLSLAFDWFSSPNMSYLDEWSYSASSSVSEATSNTTDKVWNFYPRTSDGPMYALVMGMFYDETGQWNETGDGLMQNLPFIYSCEISLHSINYTNINGTTSTSQPGPAADPAVWDMIEFFAPAGGQDTYSLGSMTNILSALMKPNISSLVTYDDLQLLVENSVRQAHGAYLSFAVQATPTVYEQGRTALLLARVARAPLWTLVSLCLLSTLLGLVAAVLALSHYSSSTLAVRSCLSVDGVIAEWCETEARDAAAVARAGETGGFRKTGTGLSGSVVVLDWDGRGDGGGTYSDDIEEGGDDEAIYTVRKFGLEQMEQGQWAYTKVLAAGPVLRQNRRASLQMRPLGARESGPTRETSGQNREGAREDRGGPGGLVSPPLEGGNEHQRSRLLGLDS